MSKISMQPPPQTLDGVAEVQSTGKSHHRFWGSARMTYTICAFLAMVLHLCMRNTLNFVILCMVKYDANQYEINTSENDVCMDDEVPNQNNGQNNTIYVAMASAIRMTIRERSICWDKALLLAHKSGTIIIVTGNLEWTRHQEISLQGTFYYGYIITLPLAGMMADRFGGKLLFVHSITVQAIIFLLMPYFARMSYTAAVVIRVLQGLISGCGNPALYKLFSTWAHPTERTAMLSFAYSGFAVGTLLTFPVSSYLCAFGWDIPFYVIGGVSLLCGISFQWLVFNTLEDHPRLSREEYEYLKVENDKSKITTVPWKSIVSSVPVVAFIMTHVFHNYGIMILSLMMPRFFKEAMHFSLSQVGLFASAPFCGSFISKGLTITSCSLIEKRPNLNLTKLRRIVYVICNCITILLIIGIIFLNCKQKYFVVILAMCIGVTTDLAFSGAYWPSLLFIAPSYAGLLSGIANCLATISGFLAPIVISEIVQQGMKSEWNLIMMTLAASYAIGAAIYGLFGSSKLQRWDQSYCNENKNKDEITII